MLDYQRALIELMVIASASDGRMADVELDALSWQVRFLPIFAGVAAEEIGALSEEVAHDLSQEDGIARALTRIRAQLPESLRETAYALAVEVVAADLIAREAELQLLNFIRDALEVDDLAAAAIEHGARVRHRQMLANPA